MSKFEFVLNNDLQNEFRNLNKKIEPLKFDILVGNEIKLKGTLYEELNRILQNPVLRDFPITTEFTPLRDSSSLCRKFLRLITYPGRFITYNYDMPAMCFNSIESEGSNINCRYDVVNNHDMIQSINFATQNIVSTNILRTINQDILIQRMLSSLYSFEDRLFCNLLNAQSHLHYTVTVNQQIESIFYDMINRLESENLRFESFLIHPRIVHRLQNTRILNRQENQISIFGIPVNSSPILEENEVYLLSNNLGQMYMFGGIEFNNIEMFDIASYRFLVREHLNLTMTNNYVKVRIN